MASSIQSPTSDANRHSADFHPTVWGDHFLNYSADSTVHPLAEQVEVLKEDVRKMFASATGDLKTKLELIDAVQRLGIAYHFEPEIGEALENIYKKLEDYDSEDDLHTVALLFRLLRQQRYKVSSSLFEKFKDENNNFKEELVNDVKGMLSLYEASHLLVHGEEILDEALEFTTINLEKKAKEVSCSASVADQINHALKRPIRKDITRQEARYSIKVHQQDESCDQTVLRLAMLDFHLLQKLQQEELSSLTNYMQVCYKGILGVYDEIEEESAKAGVDYIKPYLKEATKNLVRAYLTEARWFNQNHVPTTDEYIQNALVSSVYPMLILVSFCGMGKIASKEAFDWLISFPKMVKAASTICRLMDDVVSHKFEQSRGHVASAVECYMKEHGASEEEAYDALYKMVSEAWKDINEEMLEPAVPMPLLTCILNLARVIDVVYKDEDGYTDSKYGLKAVINTLIVEPLSL